MQTGGMLTLSEVAALLDISTAAVHKLPLPSIRLGRVLRFDPVDVGRLIASSKEPVSTLDANPHHLSTVYFGMKYFEETQGGMGYMVTLDTAQRMEWDDVIEALQVGKVVTIAPANQIALSAADAMLNGFKTEQSKGQ
jgi:hypothetical protein